MRGKSEDQGFLEHERALGGGGGERCGEEKKTDMLTDRARGLRRRCLKHQGRFDTSPPQSEKKEQRVFGRGIRIRPASPRLEKKSAHIRKGGDGVLTRKASEKKRQRGDLLLRRKKIWELHNFLKAALKRDLQRRNA